MSAVGRTPYNRPRTPPVTAPVRKLIFRSFQCPGDIMMLTAAVRDLQKAYPGRFEIDVRTSATGLWENNPYLTALKEGDPGVCVIEMQYPLINHCNSLPYPHHQFLHRNGALPCCEHGGCWKSRCQPVGDGDRKDRDLCVDPVAVREDLQIPKCMHIITPDDVIRAIETYYEGGGLTYNERPHEDC